MHVHANMYTYISSPLQLRSLCPVSMLNDIMLKLEDLLYLAPSPDILTLALFMLGYSVIYIHVEACTVCIYAAELPSQ